MSAKHTKLMWRCRWGFHKWLYVGWPHHPFYGAFTPDWRGCVLCHKTQYQYHTPQGIGRGEGALLLQYSWVDVPNMRIKSNWKQFQHPSGWTDEWFDIPFEGLMSVKTQAEYLAICRH